MVMPPVKADDNHGKFPQKLPKSSH